MSSLQLGMTPATFTFHKCVIHFQLKAKTPLCFIWSHLMALYSCIYPSLTYLACTTSTTATLTTYPKFTFSHTTQTCQERLIVITAVFNYQTRSLAKVVLRVCIIHLQQTQTK